MAAFDLSACVLILLLLIYGMVRGVIRLTLSFAGLAAGWALAVRYDEPLAARFAARPAQPPPGPDLIRLASAACIFIAVVVAAWILAWLIVRALGAVKLRFLDRMAGAGLGVLMAIMLICALTIPLLAHTPPDGGALLRQSVLAPYAIAGGDYLTILVPDDLKARFDARARAFFNAPPRSRPEASYDGR